MKVFIPLPVSFHVLILITFFACPLASAQLRTPGAHEAVQNAVNFRFDSNTLIQQFISYYQGRGHATMETGLRRSGRYLPMARKIFREVGVPEDIAWLAQVESSWNPNYSNIGRAGLWQLSSDIGKTYGLRQTAWVDERKSFEQATRASASYLRDLARRYNSNWELAITAYKTGEDNTNRAIKRAGSANFWMDYPYLPEDSRNTVPQVLATILIAKNPEKYGFNSIRPDEPLAYDVVNLPSATNLLLIASAADTSIDNIRRLNPELSRNITPPAESYNVRVPAGSGKAFISILKHVPTDVRTLWTSVPESIRQSLPKAVIVNEVKDDFDLSAEQLPPNYRGIDITKLYENYITRKQTTEKDEFETTEQFRQRVKQAEAQPILGNLVVGSITAAELEKVRATYNADDELMEIFVTVPSRFSKLQFSNNENKIFAAKLKMDIPTAKRTKPNLHALAVFRLPSSHLVEDMIPAELLEVWIYDITTGRVHAKKKTNEASTSGIEQAQKLYEAGDDDDALDELNRVLINEPMNANAHLLIGRIYQRRGDLQRAIRSLKTALFWSDQKLIDAHILLGNIYLERGDRAQALTHARAAIQLAPDNPEANALLHKLQ